jgi:hypothetical protein
LESEKTAVIAEFLAEVEMSLMKFEGDLIACIDWGFPREENEDY